MCISADMSSCPIYVSNGIPQCFIKVLLAILDLIISLVWFDLMAYQAEEKFWVKSSAIAAFIQWN